VSSEYAPKKARLPALGVIERFGKLCPGINMRYSLDALGCNDHGWISRAVRTSRKKEHHRPLRLGNVRATRVII
jgi:hypothetical protein